MAARRTLGAFKFLQSADPSTLPIPDAIYPNGPAINISRADESKDQKEARERTEAYWGPKAKHFAANGNLPWGSSEGEGAIRATMARKWNRDLNSVDPKETTYYFGRPQGTPETSLSGPPPPRYLLSLLDRGEKAMVNLKFVVFDPLDFVHQQHFKRLLFFDSLLKAERDVIDWTKKEVVRLKLSPLEETTEKETEERFKAQLTASMIQWQKINDTYLVSVHDPCNLTILVVDEETPETF